MTFPDHTLTALLGLAVGDACGVPFEFSAGAAEHAQTSIREKRYLQCYEDVKAPIRRCRTSGLYSDDTQQSLILLWGWNQMTEKGKDPMRSDLMAEVFLKVCQRMASDPSIRQMSAFGLHRGTGRNFREAISQGKPPDTAGLGAAMRIGPVATMIPLPQGVLPWVVQVSSVTTSNPIALAGAAMFALACFEAAYPEMDTSEEALQPTLPKDLEDAWHLLVEAQKILQNKGEKGLLAFASKYTKEDLKCAAGGYALTGVPWVLKCVSDATSFEDALLRVCSSGGDTDTVCAMAGCLAALRFGRESIPEWMVEGLVGKEHILDPNLWHPLVSERPYIVMDRDLQAQLEKRFREEDKAGRLAPKET